MIGFVMGVITSILLFAVWRFVLPTAFLIAIITGVVMCDVNTV